MSGIDLTAYNLGFPGGASGKKPACQCRRFKNTDSILGQKDPLEKGMATHLSILAWRIPWRDEAWQANPIDCSLPGFI